MVRAMWCTCVNGSHGDKCQMRKLWEKNKFMKIKKNGGNNTCGKEGKWGGSFPHLTNSVNDNQKERKRSERRK